MTTEEFVRLIEKHVARSAVTSVEATLRSPPGRNPAAEDLAVSGWYNKLPPHDKKFVADIVKIAVDDAVFGFLNILDGTRAPIPGGSFVLVHVDNGSAALITCGDGAPLHELYNFLDLSDSL
jgi:hypothetical protein